MLTRVKLNANETYRYFYTFGLVSLALEDTCVDDETARRLMILGWYRIVRPLNNGSGQHGLAAKKHEVRLRWGSFIPSQDALKDYLDKGTFVTHETHQT